MTRAQVLKLARARWDKLAHVRDNPRASTKAEHEQASAELRELRANQPDPVTREWKERVRQLCGVALSRRYAVGRINPYVGAFVVEGDGDSWDEAAAKAGLIPHNAPNVEANR